jgi:hypothetical protein
MPGSIRPLNLNDVFDWLYESERHRKRAAGFSTGRRRVLKTAAGFAMLSLGAWGAAGAYGQIKQRNEQRELELLGRLERAGAEYRSGNYEAVMLLLAGDGLTSSHERAVEWDTLYLFAAANRSTRTREAEEEPERENTSSSVLQRAEHVLQNTGLKDPHALARIRFARAQACAVLRCGSRQLRDDLEYVVENARERTLRRKARAALADLE